MSQSSADSSRGEKDCGFFAVFCDQKLIMCCWVRTEEISLERGRSFIRRLHLADSIHSDIIHFIFIATRSFYDEKRLT